VAGHRASGSRAARVMHMDASMRAPPVCSMPDVAEHQASYLEAASPREHPEIEGARILTFDRVHYASGPIASFASREGIVGWNSGFRELFGMTDGQLVQCRGMTCGQLVKYDVAGDGALNKIRAAMSVADGGDATCFSARNVVRNAGVLDVHVVVLPISVDFIGSRCHLLVGFQSVISDLQEHFDTIKGIYLAEGSPAFDRLMKWAQTELDQFIREHPKAKHIMDIVKFGSCLQAPPSKPSCLEEPKFRKPSPSRASLSTCSGCNASDVTSARNITGSEPETVEEVDDLEDGVEVFGSFQPPPMATATLSSGASFGACTIFPRVLVFCIHGLPPAGLFAALAVCRDWHQHTEEISRELCVLHGFKPGHDDATWFDTLRLSWRTLLAEFCWKWQTEESPPPLAIRDWLPVTGDALVVESFKDFFLGTPLLASMSWRCSVLVAPSSDLCLVGVAFINSDDQIVDTVQKIRTLRGPPRRPFVELSVRRSGNKAHVSLVTLCKGEVRACTDDELFPCVSRHVELDWRCAPLICLVRPYGVGSREPHVRAELLLESLRVL